MKATKKKNVKEDVVNEQLKHYWKVVEILQKAMNQNRTRKKAVSLHEAVSRINTQFFPKGYEEIQRAYEAGVITKKEKRDKYFELLRKSKKWRRIFEEPHLGGLLGILDVASKRKLSAQESLELFKNSDEEWIAKLYSIVMVRVEPIPWTDKQKLNFLIECCYDIEDINEYFEYELPGHLPVICFNPVEHLPEGKIKKTLKEVRVSDVVDSKIQFAQGRIDEGFVMLAESLKKKHPPIRQLIAEGEGPSTEFKETLEFSIRTGRKDSAVLTASLKTIAAFLNSEGGTLLIGVSDTGEVKGLKRDFQLCGKRGDNDGFEQKVRNLISTHLDPVPIGNVKISFERFSEGEICVIEVKGIKKSDVVHLDKEVYVRDGNVTRRLNGPALTRWIMERGTSQGS